MRLQMESKGNRTPFPPPCYRKQVHSVLHCPPLPSLSLSKSLSPRQRYVYKSLMGVLAGRPRPRVPVMVAMPVLHPPLVFSLLPACSGGDFVERISVGLLQNRPRHLRVNEEAIEQAVAAAVAAGGGGDRLTVQELMLNIAQVAPCAGQPRVA